MSQSPSTGFIAPGPSGTDSMRVMHIISDKRRLVHGKLTYLCLELMKLFKNPQKRRVGSSCILMMRIVKKFLHFVGQTRKDRISRRRITMVKSLAEAKRSGQNL